MKENMKRNEINAESAVTVYQIYCDRGNGPTLEGCWGSENARFSTQADAQEACDHLASVYDDCVWTVEDETENIQSGVAFSQAQLEAGFYAVCDKTDWKAPIDAVVGATLLGLVWTAIRHFTATCPKVTRLENGNFSVTSIGYRKGPAGDH